MGPGLRPGKRRGWVLWLRAETNPETRAWLSPWLRAWLRAGSHPKNHAASNCTPWVAIMENVLYWDFLGDTGLPPKPWRTVSDILAKLPGVKKYQADWRSPTGEGPTPVVFKVSKRRRRRAKVVQLAAAKRERA
jgi:hypothetical protein